MSSNRVDNEQRYYEDGESEHEGLWDNINLDNLQYNDDRQFHDDQHYNDDRLFTINEPENLPEVNDYEVGFQITLGKNQFNYIYLIEV